MTDIVDVVLPDIGDFDSVDVIEVLVSAGDTVAAEDSLVTLESDKATMEIPAPQGGEVVELKVAVGDKIAEGAVLMTLRPVAGAEPPAATLATKVEPEKPAAPAKPAPPPKAATPAPEQRHHPVADHHPLPRGQRSHASPSVRRFARELGVVLAQVRGTGVKNRILKEDVQEFVKTVVGGFKHGSEGFSLPQIPDKDFSKFGEIEKTKLSKIKKISGGYLHRSWVNVPHVTHFDEADITDMEAFRKASKAEAETRGVKLTALSFLMKATVDALIAIPEFNSSLVSDGETLILKKYFHIGVAVDTPGGLVVPVIRNVDQKDLFEIGAELGEVSGRAREGRLLPQDMQGGSFSISSLGGIGGTGFTPIVNAPEVAIMGVSRAQMKPVFQDDAFIPRLILPFSISYDHRVVDGAAAARFCRHLAESLGNTDNFPKWAGK
ncbi:MAG TPA: dihydrolipoyllysine-residue acetyltransferase [Chromatiales bacterium]|nr:dihydrolipoyllysine-residue acetyltransferase [Chromatiales bacterium]